MEDARRVWNAALREPEAIALFLDFDGTLVEIAETPEATECPPALPALLARLAVGLSGALALVSGRSIADLDRRLAPFRCAAAGVHGAEFRRDADSQVVLRTAPLDARVRSDVAKLAGDDPRLLVEDKGGAIAVHYRLAEHLGPELERRLEDYIRASDGELMVQPGRKVFEVLGGAVSKGDAVRRFMKQPPFAGRRPLMIGDDRTDLSAFEVCVALGGAGLRVAGEFFASDAADFASPAEVRQWLGAQAELFFAPEIR